MNGIQTQRGAPAMRDEAPRVPRWALLTAGLLMTGTIGLAAIARIDHTGGHAVDWKAGAVPVVFRQQAQDAITVTTRSGAPIATIAPTQDAFLRTTMRTMLQARAREGKSRSAPFLLIPERGGALVLDDPLTGRNIFLQAFGPANQAQFAALLPPKRT
jgi:putative photosynthetic complex assembly protein